MGKLSIPGKSSQKRKLKHSTNIRRQPIRGEAGSKGPVGSRLGGAGDKAVRAELNVSTAGKGTRNGVYQDVVTN